MIARKDLAVEDGIIRLGLQLGDRATDLARLVQEDLSIVEYLAAVHSAAVNKWRWSTACTICTRCSRRLLLLLLRVWSEYEHHEWTALVVVLLAFATTITLIRFSLVSYSYSNHFSIDC